MSTITILIKPASSSCNMNCSYCFYKDISSKRNINNYGLMNNETVTSIIKKALNEVTYSCSFCFQGGEPTIAGLDFYKNFICTVNKLNKSKLQINYSIQTNGYLLNQEWIEFFKQNNFLVGISLDGPADIHNLNRLDCNNKGTFNKIMSNISLLKKNNIPFNILSVVTKNNAKKIESIFNFFMKKDFNYLQFIPCLDPLGEDRGNYPYSLSVSDYSNFLIKLFDLWYNELLTGHYISIRHIDNWISNILGLGTESCNMHGKCSNQLVVEANGDVFPCDFYVIDKYKLGNINHNKLSSLINHPIANNFIAESTLIPQKCEQCNFYAICKNGCRRNRLIESSGIYGINYFCKANYNIFENRQYQLGNAAHIIRSSFL